MRKGTRVKIAKKKLMMVSHMPLTPLPTGLELVYPGSTVCWVIVMERESLVPIGLYMLERVTQ